MYTYLKFGLPRVMPMGLEEVVLYQTNFVLAIAKSQERITLVFVVERWPLFSD